MQNKPFVKHLILLVLHQNNVVGVLGFVFILFTTMANADGLPPLTHKLTPVKTKISAPSLRFKNMDDEEVDIKDFKGKVVVVNFWATWCPPCRREMGSLERLHQTVKDKNIEVLAVNIGEDNDTVFSFTGTVEPSPEFQILFDTNADSMKKWDVRGLPTTYVIRPNQTIAYKAVGGREFDHPDIVNRILGLSLKTH